MSLEMRRAADRFVSTQPGIVSSHAFSAGAHYDPSNVSFGAVIGVDEHAVEPGAGFDWHAHRGVTIASWVLEGTLRHADSTGAVRLIGPGELFVQQAGDGIRHAETNASETAALRFVQTTLLCDPPSEIIVVRTATTLPPHAHAYVARGSWNLAGVELCEGDSVRVAKAVAIDGAGELLVVRRVES